jgi:hypothetical protein
MYNSRALTYLLIIMLFAFPIRAYSAGTETATIDQKAVLTISNEALANLVRYALTEKNATAFGFKNLKEAQSARVDTPFKVLSIGLRELKNYNSGSGPRSILTDPGILWFPVMVDDEFKTKLELVRQGDQWIPGEFGDARSALEVSAVRVKLKDLLRSKGVGDSYTTSLVQIPALLATFLYVESSKGEFLIPAMVNPERYNLGSGKIYAADEVLTALKVFAAEIKEGTIR